VLEEKALNAVQVTKDASVRVSELYERAYTFYTFDWYNPKTVAATTRILHFTIDDLVAAGRWLVLAGNMDGCELFSDDEKHEMRQLAALARQVIKEAASFQSTMMLRVLELAASKAA